MGNKRCIIVLAVYMHNEFIEITYKQNIEFKFIST